MSEKYPHVFSPIEIGPVAISNRFYFSPHGQPFNAGGSPSDAFVGYYGERAAGGCGLLIHGMPALPNESSRYGTYFELTVPSLAAVADAIHEHGSKLFAQVHYHPNNAGHWGQFSPPRPFLAPTPYQKFEIYHVGHEMSRSELRQFVEAYRRGAGHLVKAGYDGIEVHCTHGVMLETFLSPYWNRRTDEYGGSLENRMRLLVEVLEATREGANGEMAVGMRFNCDEMLPGGLTQDDTSEILAQLVEKDLLDFVDLDIAVEPNQVPLGMPSYFIEPFVYESFVAGVRQAAGSVPVLSVLGRVTSIADAERALASGVVDMVGAARGLIAEPELVKNAREGREHRSRVCIACDYCIGEGSHRGGVFGCMINPATGRERDWGVATFAPADHVGKVVVAGGGPAGLEAARVAAMCGHEVVLFEREAKLGGQMRVWASLPSRDSLAAGYEWLASEVKELGVDVRTGTEATVDLVLAQQPAGVIVATGSRYAEDGESGFMVSPVPGWDQDFVYTPEQILVEGRRPTGKVVILDEEALNTGAGIAEVLAREGAAVEIVSRYLQLVQHTYIFEWAAIIPTLKSLGVIAHTGMYVKEIGNRSVCLFDVLTNEETEIRDVDAVVLVTMRRPLADLARQLEDKVPQLFPVGDALGPRGVAAATFEGQKFARFIGQDDAPQTFVEAYYELPSRPAYSTPAAAARTANVGAA